MHQNSPSNKLKKQTLFSVKDHIGHVFANIFSSSVEIAGPSNPPTLPSTQHTTPNQPEHHGAEWSPPAIQPITIPHQPMAAEASTSYRQLTQDHSSLVGTLPPFHHTTLANSKHYNIFNTFLQFVTTC